MNEIIIPNGCIINEQDAAAYRAQIVTHERELSARLRDIIERLKAEPQYINELTQEVSEAEDEIEELRNTSKAAVRELVNRSGLGVIVKQVDDRLVSYSTKQDASSTYCKLSALIKEAKSIIKGIKDANKPAAEMFYYVAEFECSPEKADKLNSYLDKNGFYFRFRRVKDNERKRVDAMFDKLMKEGGR